MSQEAFGYALIVDSVNYTLWVMLLLFLVPFAKIFNHYTKSDENMAYLSDIGCACNMGVKRYWLLILFAIVVSFVSQIIAQNIQFLNSTTTIVLIASLFGVLGSFTRLRDMNGSSEVATTMLYVIIALIGSKAVFDSFSDVGFYVLAGFSVLVIHAVIMVIGAKIFRLDLFLSSCIITLKYRWRGISTYISCCLQQKLSKCWNINGYNGLSNRNLWWFSRRKPFNRSC